MQTNVSKCCKQKEVHWVHQQLSVYLLVYVMLIAALLSALASTFQPGWRTGYSFTLLLTQELKFIVQLGTSDKIYNISESFTTEEFISVSV